MPYPTNQFAVTNNLLINTCITLEAFKRGRKKQTGCQLRQDTSASVEPSLVEFHILYIMRTSAHIL